MPTHLLNRRLAAHSAIRNTEATVKADRIADAAERTVAGVWADLLAVLRTDAGYAANYQRARAALSRLHPAVEATLGDRLYKLALWSHREAARGLAGTLPLPWLRAMAGVPAEALRATGANSFQLAPAGAVRGFSAQFSQSAKNANAAVLEAPDPSRQPLSPDAQLARENHANLRVGRRLGGRRAGGPTGLVEAGSGPLPGDGVRHGTVAQEVSEAAPEPSRRPLSADARRDAYQSLLFPPPPAEQVTRIVYGSGWREQLQAATRLGDPDTLARVLANGVAAGKTQREVAADLLPHVQGVQTTARRLARTYGLKVAHAAQFELHEGNADLIDGYQVHSAGGHNARQNHALRSGTIYYRNPAPGQRGFDVMPHPPEDQEDPPYTHRGTAFNCRCWTSPVLALPPDILDDPARMATFETNSGKVIPDPAHYADWFDQADERRRRLAVGTRRYSTVRDLLGGEPDWAHFIDPSGELMRLTDLKAETPVQRQERTAKVNSVIAELRRLIELIATFGFSPRG